MTDFDLELPTGGGSLLLAWQLKGKRVLIVGGGDVSSGRIKSVLAADAFITLIAPRDGLHRLTRHYIDNSARITYHDRTFAGDEDLVGIDMVLTAIDDVEWSRRICALCREHRIPVNVADIPPSCDFYFGSQIRKGPLQIMISTNGNGPKLANLLKTRIEQCLPEKVDRAIENVGILRGKLRQRAPGVGGEIGKRRMQWMSTVCTNWELDELAALDDESMEELLLVGWERLSVPKPPRRIQLNKASNMSDATLATVVGFFVGIALSTAVLWNQGIYGNFFTNIFMVLRALF
ncbi:hypothetical protein EW145_g1439 [Phellinidium pouzarii]|uniref:precorrin-2 dehydrogenase n=1 Tax=Phellinidium pouzarii TaxID=167371 RepID=A0A4S4LEH3_9AGAM|nr:hypothetical protein EW145_g1439 [Phellinidium pouzarii]